MAQPGKSGKTQNVNLDSIIGPKTIYRDDPRNNPRYLKKHPKTRVIDKPAHQPVRKPHQHHPAQKHSPKTKTKSKTPKIPRHVPPTAPAGSPDNFSVNHPDDEIYDDNSLLDDPSLEPDDDRAAQNSDFIFGEMVGEEHDPLADLDQNNDQVPNQTHPDALPNSSPTTLPPSTMLIDPKSFVYQKDARSGVAGFKATLQFDNDLEIDDYEVIITQVTQI